MFFSLVALANGPVDEIPKMLLEAESTLLFFDPPSEVKTFVEHCKWLVEEMKGIVAMVIDTLQSPFYEHILGSVSFNFVDIVTIKERIEFRL